MKVVGSLAVILPGVCLAQQYNGGGGTFTFFKAGERKDKAKRTVFGESIPFCEDDYATPSAEEKAFLIEQYKKQADDRATNRLDQLVQEAVIFGLNNTYCLHKNFIDDFLAPMGLEDNFVRSADSQFVDWNCHDDECDIPVTLKGIWNYGCWCNFGSDLLKGKGQPVNPHDKVCQDMQLCLRCAEMDATKENRACNVKTQDFNSLLQMGAIGLTNNQNSINSGCITLNGVDKCAAHVCTCEVQMINDILELVWTGYTHDPNPRHPDNPYGGSFDWEDQCYIDPTGEIVKECCGKYPFRFPFNSLNKECCENGGVYEVFNPLEKVCCGDGVQQISNGGC